MEDEHHFNIGDRYQLSIGSSYVPLFNEKIYINVRYNSRLYSRLVLQSDFLPLELWREQQINKICQ
jgi:hypothetical protein